MQFNSSQNRFYRSADAVPDPACHSDADPDTLHCDADAEPACVSGSGTMPAWTLIHCQIQNKLILTNFPSSMTDFISVPRALPENKENFILIFPNHRVKFFIPEKTGFCLLACQKSTRTYFVLDVRATNRLGIALNRWTKQTWRDFSAE